MYGYIYKTTDLDNDKIYIGQHKSEIFDEKYFGSGIIISKLIKKYGTERFNCEVLEWCEDADKLNEAEIHWIKELDALNESVGYNIATGGSFGDSGYHQGMCGKTQSQKQKDAARNYQLNNSKTQQMKSKMSKAMKHNTNASNGKGMIFIHFLDDVQTRVHLDEAYKYIEQGWEFGKCKRALESQKKAFQEKYKNGTYISKDGKAKFVAFTDLQSWLNDGWKVGKKGTTNYTNRLK